jgi:glycosyltransferase involved in cell wall biosynthesis
MEAPHDSALSGPLVSVIMPVYNRAGWVARAVESVLTQTHRRVELLAVDDGSTDGTPRVLEGFGPRVRVLRQTHAGTEAARNLGLRHACGPFVAFIDSDDVWHADRLSLQLPLFDRAEVGLVFGNAALLDYRRRPPRRLRRTFFDNVRPSRGRALEAFARGCFVPCSSVLARRRCFDETGGFVPGRGAADYLKWVEISARYELDYVPAPVFDYAIHAGGLSHDLLVALEDRAEAFADALARSCDAELSRVLRKILFNVRLSLRVARLRRGLRGRKAATPQTRHAHGASPAETLSWSLRFASDRLRTRGRWLIVNSAGLLRDPHARRGRR